MALVVSRNHLFPPGPCEIAVGTKSRTSLGFENLGYEFLGITRDGGRAQEVVYSGNIATDYAGSNGMPADVCLSGKGLVVVCQLSNFNPYVMKRLKSRFWGGDGNTLNSSGLIAQHDMGALLIHEWKYIPVCIRSLNAYTDGTYNAKYPANESGLWIPICMPSGDMVWDYAAREQTYVLTFTGLTYINDSFFGGDAQSLACAYNAGVLYSSNLNDISRIWENVTNPDA